MSGAYNPNQKVQKVMVQPINLIFRYLQNRTLVSVWLYENVNTRIEGQIIGFDEYMNLVLEDAAEVHLKRRTRKEVSNGVVSFFKIVCGGVFYWVFMVLFYPSSTTDFGVKISFI